MPSSRMNFAEAVDYASSLHRSGVMMGLAVVQTAEKTGYNARELAQACAERSRTVKRAVKARKQEAAEARERTRRIKRQMEKERNPYYRATEGW